MKKPSFNEAVEALAARDTRYAAEAYHFVREGLDFTVRLLRKPEDDASRRHVSGQELLEGLRRYALEEYGAMSRMVLAHWGVTRCEDFGELVFAMVENGILGATEHDRREDFAGGYDFGHAFDRPFLPSGARRGNERAGGSAV